MTIEVSFGEVLDKISILAIKLNQIKDEDKLKNIQKEFSSISGRVPQSTFTDPLYFELCKANQHLWNIEDAIREKERLGEFDDAFIQLARQVYITNDQRAALKMKINIKYNSDIIEEKSHNPY
jgi:hypothetical protein